MGEPNIGNLYYLLNRGTHCELKYLSSNGKEIKRDSLSSGERKGSSPNLEFYSGGCRTTKKGQDTVLEE